MECWPQDWSQTSVEATSGMITASPITPLEPAARWLAEKPVGSVPNTLPTLMEQFKLSAPDAKRAIKRANVLIARRLGTEGRALGSNSIRWLRWRTAPKMFALSAYLRRGFMPVALSTQDVTRTINCADMFLWTAAQRLDATARPWLRPWSSTCRAHTHCRRGAIPYLAARSWKRITPAATFRPVCIWTLSGCNV